MYSMSHTHRLLTAVCGALCLGAVALGAQGLGRQPARYSAAIPATTPTIAPITNEATSTSEPAQVTTPTTEPTPETTEPTTPETVPVTRPRPTVPPRTIPPVIEPDESWATGACGGSLPPCWVMMRESGGDPTIWNRQGSGASGKWQFMPGTWAGYGGYSAAAYAPERVQDDKARIVWAGGRGCSHWGAC